MGRRTNLALAALLTAAVVSGLVVQGIGTDLGLDPAVVHGALALAILVLAPWKTLIVRRGLRRQRDGRGYSLALLVAVLIVLSTGLAHSHGAVTSIGPLTVMQIHVGGAILTLVLAIDHFRRHPVKPRRVDLDRRAFLRSSVVAVTAGALWMGWEGALQAVGAPGRGRRFTGSHERGSFDPSGFPVTSWFDDPIPPIDALEWSIQVAGHRLTLGDLESLGGDVLDATLDCTGGWHSEQEWGGVRLDRILEATVRRSFLVTSETGYSRLFPIRDLSRTWLVTRVGGEPLSPGHGYPARIVAPGRRGFWWVKWVVSIELTDRPWWLQSPFPLT